MKTEYEIRVLEIDKEKLIDKLEELGAKKVGEFNQKRYVYDLNPVQENKWIRLRTNGKETTLTYKSIYDGKILDKTFKGIESDWINFKWVKIEEIDKYEIHPTQIKDFIKNEEPTNHIIEEIIM